jgi:hypothetical protein
MPGRLPEFHGGPGLRPRPLVRIIKRKLKKIQHQPHLIDGCLAATGLKIERW